MKRKRTVQGYVRFNMWYPWLVAGLLFIGFCIVLLIMFVWNRNPIRWFAPISPADRRIQWMVGAVVVIATVIWAFPTSSKVGNLLKRGRRVSGVVAGKSSGSFMGASTMLFEYSIDGRNYRSKRTVIDPEVSEVSAGDAIELIYDPLQPSNALILPPSISRESAE